jgi:Ca2+-binding EF-hand superfamily protein
MNIFQRRYIVPLALIASMFFETGLFGQAKQAVQAPQPAYPNRPSWNGFTSTELLRLLDSDQDGAVTRDEWVHFFADHDTNNDNRLSSDEIQTVLPGAVDESTLGSDAARSAAFERLDANKNAAIDVSEWPGKQKDFQMLDSDRNGSLSREEFLARAGRWWNEPFENLDFNSDKVIARSEWLDSDASFNRLDRDRNGVLDRREFYNPR